MKRRPVVLAVVVVAIATSAGCDVILGIEPPTQPDAAVDATPDGIAEAGFDAGPDASAQDAAEAEAGPLTWCTTTAPPSLFCDDFDDGVPPSSRWDAVSGPVDLTASDAGSPPDALQVAATAGTVASLRKTVGTKGSATISFAAQFDCPGNPTVIAEIAPTTTNSFGHIRVFTNGSAYQFQDLTSNGQWASASCDNGWHQYAVSLKSNLVTVTFDNDGGHVIDANGPANLTSVDLFIGSLLQQAGARTVLFDNVIVTN